VRHIVLEIDVVLLEGIQHRAQGADVLVHFYLVAASPKCTISKVEICHSPFLPRAHSTDALSPPVPLAHVQQATAVGFETLDSRVTFAEAHFEL